MRSDAHVVLGVGLTPELARHAATLGVTLAASPTEAIARLSGAAPPPACLVVDDSAWSDALLSASAGLPVILLAAPATVVGDASTLAAVWDFVVKPVHPAELRHRIARAVRGFSKDGADGVPREDTTARLRSELTALAVHDLRSPLSTLKLNLDVLEQELAGADEDDSAHEALVDAQTQCARLLSLANGMLDVAELEEGLLRTALTDVSLAEFLPAILLGHQRDLAARRLRVDMDVRPAALRAWFDPDLLGRVIENLLDNAVRYAPAGGVVRLEARREGERLVLRIGNDGPGVPDAERDRIFEKFHRIEARRAGVRANRGLGLYFCKLAIEAHGGAIRVTEQPGLPTVFEVALPGWRVSSGQTVGPGGQGLRRPEPRGGTGSQG